MDFLHDSDYFESYRRYQGLMLEQFDRLAEEFGFHSIDATQSVEVVFQQLQREIAGVVADLKPESTRVAP